MYELIFGFQLVGIGVANRLSGLYFFIKWRICFTADQIQKQTNKQNHRHIYLNTDANTRTHTTIDSLWKACVIVILVFATRFDVILNISFSFSFVLRCFFSDAFMFAIEELKFLWNIKIFFFFNFSSSP